jgi:hypothetical protein
MAEDLDLEEKLMQVAFSEVRETSPEIFAKLGRTLRDGEVLFAEGDRSTELIMIVSGMCKITKVIGGEERVLAVLKPGEILGEMSHFDDAPRSATARAVGTLNVLSMSRENFGMIFELHHKWTLILIQALANRVHGTFQRLVAAHDVPAAPPSIPGKPAGAKGPVSSPGKPLPVPPPASAEGPPPGFATDRVDKFLQEMRAAIKKGAALANLRAKALERLAVQPEQRKKIETLFAYAEKRLREEGLIR